MHRRWLAGLTFEHAAHHIVLEDCIAAVEAATARRDRLEAHIEAALPDWSLAPVVHALQALRGMALVAAATLMAELGDITRFANPRQLMAYLGLVPSEHSSGSHTTPRRDHQGGQWRGAANADRGGVELPVSGADQPRAPSAPGKLASRSATSRGKPRNGCAVDIASSPMRENQDGDHRRDCARTCGLRLGDRQTRQAADA